jgi:hypothetical protein
LRPWIWVERRMLRLSWRVLLVWQEAAFVCDWALFWVCYHPMSDQQQMQKEEEEVVSKRAESVAWRLLSLLSQGTLDCFFPVATFVSNRTCHRSSRIDCHVRTYTHGTTIPKQPTTKPCSLSSVRMASTATNTRIVHKRVASKRIEVVKVGMKLCCRQQ